jgi:outer membrane lipoprotein-sorting protein
MKKYLILITIMLTISAAIKADDTAKSILDKLSQNTKNSKSITADFDFIMENAEVGLNESNKGKIIIQDNKYKLSISGIEIMSDGETMWTYMPDANEVSISNSDSFEDSGINPATIFTIYEQGFEYSYLGEFQSGNNNIYKIDLVPTDEREFSRVILEINTTNYQISRAVMYGTDGNRYIINILKYDSSKTYDNSTFLFDSSKNPEVAIIDMR